MSARVLRLSLEQHLSVHRLAYIKSGTMPVAVVCLKLHTLWGQLMCLLRLKQQCACNKTYSCVTRFSECVAGLCNLYFKQGFCTEETFCRNFFNLTSFYQYLLSGKQVWHWPPKMSNQYPLHELISFVSVWRLFFTGNVFYWDSIYKLLPKLCIFRLDV